MATQRQRSGRQVGYAVIGLGHIAQSAMLPAFAHARRSSKLVALVSGDRDKQVKLGRKYGARAYSYAELDECLSSPDVDAVYIATPNDQHADIARAAAAAGVHVLCEKPMEIDEARCEAMIRACKDGGVRLMIAYRLHFEPANLAVVKLVEDGRIGEPRFFSSDFSYQVRPGNIRTQAEHGGGALWDIGVYCINAARYLFRDEPTEVVAFAAQRPDDPRFASVGHEGMSALLRFSGDRLATFTCSFGAAATATYRIVGTEGSACLDQAYEYQGTRELTVTVGDKTRTRKFKPSDHFGPELVEFSRCVLADEDPEPNGLEGLADVRIIQALLRSARDGKPVRVAPVRKDRRPEPSQRVRRAPVRESALVHAEAPVLE